MSRYTKIISSPNGGMSYEVAYGYDHLDGYFIQVFTYPQRTDDDDDPFMNLTNITKATLIATAEEYGVTISPDEDIESNV